MQAIENPKVKVDELARIIRLYLQFVDPESICEHTGLRLNDIWRYFRHTWVNSYKSIPGRSMMVLVRDAAAPYHPVIGISCLGNSVVQQSARDQWIGWDAKQVVERFSTTSNPKKLARWLLSQLEALIRGIYLKDLLDEGVVTRADLRKSSESENVIVRLLEDAERAINHHRLYPHTTKHKSTPTATKAEWQERAETSLFRSKRARNLATLLGIRRVFEKQGLDPSTSVGTWKKAFENARFRQAVSQLVRFVKAERVGINMMDLTVCGAVAPYNLLLGGKLVCLLLCSPEVVRKYAARYNEQMSLIASSMRGAAVTRGAQLVLLCTTSLFGSSLSQYSRIKAFAELLGGTKGEKVEYEVVGMSEGFGSFQFSKETLRLMSMLLGRANRARKVNSIFGEGVNPLMRKIREALSQLGLPDNSLLKHGSKRVVYGVPLASNFREVLLGLADVPHYIVPQTREKVRTEFLADYWRQRWLLRRLERPGILDEIARHTKIYPIRHGAQIQRPREPDEPMSLWDMMS